ncbi:MAG: sulfatase [Planctomycetota bacterium]
MRILYIDIDALRPDHLSCYGYHRLTSPSIDRLAADGLRFENCYASDTPCCPSRTSLFLGQPGICHGSVCHAGRRAVPYAEGQSRGFRDRPGRDSWPAALREAGYHTATISSFADRHGARWWQAGFHELHDTGGRGFERADQVTPVILDWLDRQGATDQWFLHVNFWDVHTPYRTPSGFGAPFRDDPLPTWYDDALRQKHWTGAGPQGARERGGLGGGDDHAGRYPRQPFEIASMDDVRRMFDGYDTAIRYVDKHIDLIVSRLETLGVLDDTAIMVSSDHGETIGEFNIYGCHQLADHVTCRVPMIVRWPGVTDRPDSVRADGALRYHFDIAASVIEAASGSVPESWHGRSFELGPNGIGDTGRDDLVLSHLQGSCQRSLRFRRDQQEFICIRTYHDGYHGLPEAMLFDVGQDPHELHDLAEDRPDLVAWAFDRIEGWTRDHLEDGRPDPMATVLAEGGPPHARGALNGYLDRLRATGRSVWADHFETRTRPFCRPAFGSAGDAAVTPSQFSETHP